MSADDFFLDINLMLGIPAPIKDTAGVGDFQAWQIPEFSALAANSPNCSGLYADPNVVANLWAWGFWGGQMPYVSHTETGYDPLSSNELQGKWLIEFGVIRAGGILPAFAFSMMPKVLPLMAPKGMGSSFPYFVMGDDMDTRKYLASEWNLKAGSTSTFMFLVGQGALYGFAYFSHGIFLMYQAFGIYAICYSFVALIYAGYRMKSDGASQ